MADPGAAAAALTDAQQTALANFVAVTNQEPEAAIPLLRRSQWNVQIAITKFFDGEAPDPVEEALAAPPPAHDPSRREVLIDGSSSWGVPSAASRPRDPAPRIVPQPESRSVYKPPFVLSLFLAPLNLVLRLFSGSFGFFSYLFPFLPRLLSRLTGRGQLSPSSSSSAFSHRDTSGRRPLNPRDTAARFIREFGEEYGTSHGLPFFEDGYAQAHDMAKRDLKLLLVILLSPEHDDTSQFVRGTLLSPEVISFLSDSHNRIILWAGTVQDSEAYQVSNALNCTKFPFTALVARTSPNPASPDAPLGTSMSTLVRCTGPQTPSAFLSKIRSAVRQHAPALDRARRDAQATESARNLRNQQNLAYERSLAQDRERARLRREEEAARARAEQERSEREAKARVLAEKRDAWRRWRACQLLPEPSATTGPDVVRLSVRLSTGQRLVRRFPATANVEAIYAYVECHDLLSANNTPTEKTRVDPPPSDYKHEYAFNLISPIPRVVYDVNSTRPLGETIGRSANLIVEATGAEDEGED